MITRKPHNSNNPVRNVWQAHHVLNFAVTLENPFVPKAWSEMDLAMHEAGLDILGPRGQLLPEASEADGVGSWLDGYLFSLAGPIYAGTNEIQRNVIAERILGLPRK